MVDQYSAHVLMSLGDIKSLKNKSDHQVKISIPKVAKNSQKVPILAKSELRVVTSYFYHFWGTHLITWVGF